MQEGERARVDAVREVDGAGHAEHLRGARSCDARIASRRTYDAQRRPVCRKRALYKVRDATVLERVRRLEVLVLRQLELLRFEKNASGLHAPRV